MLTSSVVDLGFDLIGTSQMKDNEISIWCFFAKHAALRVGEIWDQDNVSHWSNISIVVFVS
jgi:hypothetical protein